ncbi:MAG: choloylglycine hydrolase family protein [Clostridiales bacterium]|nr:choloylglycine hydrolase family protein [Clostridiales bacterium]
MCTAVAYKTKDHYFGRTLDLDFSHKETITITPRNFPFSFRKVKNLQTHYAMIGMAFVVQNYPLYYDATNEKGLSMAGLNFPEYADYKLETEELDNVAPFEFIPWILGQCATISEVRKLLDQINLVHIDFSQELILTPLHWMISDQNSSITVECVKDGLKVYDNPVEVLTNNPPFDYQMCNLNNYMNLTCETATNRFAKNLSLSPYSLGMGGIGLPGDFSSSSRFVKAAFVKMNSICGESECESISQFFHILSSVGQPRGCVQTKEGHYATTIYSSCCNTNRGIYYYTTYENCQITGVDMYRTNLNSCKLVSYPLIRNQQIRMQNYF